jgi:hypothetical protein
MVNKAYAAIQIRRFAGLDFFPHQAGEAIVELVVAAMSAHSEEICKAACDSILFDAVKCPKPAEVRLAVKSEYERRLSTEIKREPRPNLCKWCESNGYIQDSGVFKRCLHCPNGGEFPETLLELMNTPPGPKPSIEGRIRNAVRMGEILSRS